MFFIILAVLTLILSIALIIRSGKGLGRHRSAFVTLLVGLAAGTLSIFALMWVINVSVST